MKTKQELLSMMYAILAELQSKTTSEQLTKNLKIQLELLYDILNDDVPEEYWQQVENEL